MHRYSAKLQKVNYLLFTDFFLSKLELIATVSKLKYINLYDEMNKQLKFTKIRAGEIWQINANFFLIERQNIIS